jgi:general secretion pathway protein D
VVNVFAADRTNRQQRTVPGLSIPPAPGPRAPGAATTGTAPGVPGQPATVTPAGAGQAAVPGAADAAAGKEEEVFPPGLIKFSDADIGQVLEIYQELTGRTVLKPNSLPAVKVTIRSQTQLTRSEAIHALDSILSLNGVAMVPQGEKFVKALAEAQGGQAAQRFNELPHDLLPEAGSLVTHVVQLKNAIPTEIQPALQAFAKLPNSILAINSTSMLVLRDYAENVKRMLEILEQIDIVPPQDFVDVVIPIRYALAGDIAQVLSSLTAGGGGATTVGRAATRSGLSSGGGLGGGLGGAGSIPGQPGYNPAQALQQQQGAAGGIGGAAAQRSSFADRLRSIVNRAGPGGTGDIFVLGQTKIIADERTNSLLIFASKQDLGTISNIIDKLDVVLAQVIIEGIFMEVALGDDLDYAVSLVQKTPSTSGQTLGIGASKNHNQTLNIGNFLGSGSNALSSGLSYFANINDDLEATFTAIANDRNVNVLARPRIQTSHAEEANLFVGETRPYITGTYNSFQGVGGSSTYSQLQIGLTLSVLPLINADGLVVMDIRQKIQQIGEEVIIDGNPIPATIDREANAKVSVRDREVILLGGMISAESRKSKSGVPILKDIPGFGAFFRAASKEQQRRELVVLIRPTVLPTPQEAAIVASEERALLPGIAEWERDVRKDERKRVEDYNKRLYKREGFKK